MLDDVLKQSININSAHL